MEIADRVHHFTNYKFNWYLIEDQGRLTVLDTGFPGHYRLFERSVQSIGRCINDVEAIIITHAHADHTGMAPRIHRESGAPIYLHEADAPHARRPLYLPWAGLLTNAWRPYTASMLAHAIFNGLLRLPTITSSTHLGDGQTLDAPGQPHIIHLPGHTDGEVVVHLPDRGILFSGDALVTRSLLSGEDGLPQVTAPLLNDDYDEGIQQLARIQNLGEVTMLPGHGRPWSGDIQDAIASATASASPRRR